MKKLNSLNDVLFEQVLSIHSNIKTVISDLPYLIDRSNNPELKTILKKYYDALRMQEQRVHLIFKHFEASHSSSGYETREMLKNIYGRIGRSSDTFVIDSIVTIGLTQISGFMTINMNIAKALSENLELKHLNEYIEESLRTESRFLSKLLAFEDNLVS